MDYKILNVDLTSGLIKEEKIDDKLIQNYLGGYGLGVKLLYDRIPKGIDPLGPNNILGFFPGLLTGSIVPFTGRYMVCCKSPLTGTWNDSNSGGYFGPEIQKCGYIGILISGKAEKPMYLLIQNGKSSLEDAADLWGKDAIVTEEIIQEKKGNRVHVSAIGQAGENLCLNACIVNDRGRVAGRAGVGAVMGSKNLKALALEGNQKYTYVNFNGLKPIVQDYNANLGKIKKSKFWKKNMDLAPALAGPMRILKQGLFSTVPMAVQYLSNWGTSFSLGMSTAIGDCPVKNWTGVGYKDFPKDLSKPLSGPNLLNWKVKPYGCFSCPVRCGAILKVPEADLEETHRAEYETLGTFGPLILNHDLTVIFKVNEYLNRVGLDSISAGAIVAFAIECFENGLISTKETKGMEFRWNTSGYIMNLLKMIVERDQIGDILADGVKKAAEKIGKGAEKFAVHANGQELPMHDSRHSPSLACSYVADPSPGRHTAASIDFMEIAPVHKFLAGVEKPPPHKKHKYGTKGPAQAHMVKIHQTINALGFCYFGTICGPLPLLESLKCTHGWDLTHEDLFKIGYRIQTLRQLFNVRDGAVQFDINERALGIEPLKKGPLKGITVDVRTMTKDYFKNMDWDPDKGIPTEETIKKLGLEFAMDALDSAGECGDIYDLPSVSK